MMEVESIRDWKSLPAELLVKVFRVVNQDPGLHYSIQVCKSWTVPAQSVLYLKVVIYDLLQLRNFHFTVEHNQQLGKMVKSFKLNIQIENPFNLQDVFNLEIFNLLTSLLCNYLPYLEYLEEDSLHTYLPMLNALNNSQLKHLKKLNAPNESFQRGLVDYTQCVLLLKDRIEEIDIIERLDVVNIDFTNQVHSDLIINHLHQFNRLTAINFTKDTIEDIIMLDRILINCRYLVDLSVNFDPTNIPLLNSGTTVGTVMSMIPLQTIRTFNCRAAITNNHKIIIYIMRKFPNLNSLTFHVYENRSVTLTSQMMNQLLNHARGIAHYDIKNIRVERHLMAETIRNFWFSNTESVGAQSVQIVFNDNHNKQIFDISYGKFLLKFRPSRDDYNRFIYINGIFIKDLQIRYTHPINLYSLPADFIIYLYQNCPHIKSLSLERFIVKQFYLPLSALNRKRSLDRLYLINCTLESDVLNRMSRIIPQIKQLHIRGKVSHKANEDTGSNVLNIIMKSTTIDRVIVEDVDSNEIVFVKIFLLVEERYAYYRNLVISNEAEYNNTNDNLHIYIHCKTVPTLEFSNS